MGCAWTRLIPMLLPKLKCLLIADKVTRQIANCRIRFQFAGSGEVQKKAPIIVGVFNLCRLMEVE